MLGQEQRHIDLQKLKNLTWNGIPQNVPSQRCHCWKLLLDYLPIDKDFQDAILKQKREEYNALVLHYFGDFTAGTVQNMLKEAKQSKMKDQDAPAFANFNEFERKNFKQIKIDVQRTQPTLEAFRAP